MTFTREILRKRRDELNRQDAPVLVRLFAAALCMRRRIVADGAEYVFCEKAARNSVGGGKILLCKSHREQ